MARFFLVLILLGLPVPFGQANKQTHDELRADTQNAIASLYKKFEGLRAISPREKELQAACAVNCSDPQLQSEMGRLNAERLARMEEVVSQMHRCVDQYIVRTVNPKRVNLHRSAVAKDLKQILDKAAEGLPAPFVLNSPKGDDLIVLYTFWGGMVAGDHATSVTLRSYKTFGNMVRLTDVTGNDMDGYASLSVKQLHSPVPNEIWWLVWGQATGASGPNTRMRVYAYDGRKFRTIWMPANVWGTFTISLTESGFKVSGPYYRENKERHDTYTVAPDGLHLTSISK